MRNQYIFEHIPWMDHVNTMFQSDSDNIVLSEVSADRCKSLSNLICLIGLDKKEM